jgi:restriction system protein
MKEYFRAILGAGGTHAEACFSEGWIGADHCAAFDLATSLPPEWEGFKTKFSEVYLKTQPGKSKIAAGLAAGVLFRVCRGMKEGDLILASAGMGNYRLAEVVGPYFYKPGATLPHRRKVHWLDIRLTSADLSDGLRASAGATTAIIRLTEHGAELEQIAAGNRVPRIVATDASIEDPATFALEKHLEDFLAENWASTELAARYEIFSEDGESVGKQYPTEAGPIDILAVSKDKKELLVIELKKGRASDLVVGQIQRYMGYVTEELAETGQSVRGLIIAHQDDKKIRWALKVTNNIDFYTYRIDFKLRKSE